MWSLSRLPPNQTDKQQTHWKPLIREPELRIEGWGHPWCDLWALVLDPEMTCAMPPTPRGHQAEDGAQTFAMFRKGILDARRDFRIDPAVDNVVAFEFAKLLRQHFLGRTCEELLQLAETPDLCLKVVQNRGLPFPADDMSSECNGAI